MIRGRFHCIPLIFSVDCVREKQQRKKWTLLVEDWKKLLFKNTLNTFIRFMKDREIVCPSEMTSLKESLASDQRGTGLKRKELMERIMDLKPPNITPSMIYEWREKVDTLYEELGVCVYVYEILYFEEEKKEGNLQEILYF